MKETNDQEKIPTIDNGNGKPPSKTDRLIDTFIKQLGWALGSIILALLVAALIMIATGYDPVAAYSALIRGALRNPDQILWRATPLILTGLSVALAFQAGLFNIGAEGQLYIGSMAATVVGFMILLPVIIHPVVCLIVAAIIGALWGLIPGVLKAYRGAHEVVTTMMLTYVAILFTNFLVVGPLKEPGQWAAQTPPLFPTAWLPKIGFGVWESDFLSWGFFVAIICVIVVWIFLNKMVLGYEMRAVGSNEKAAEAAGIKPKHMVVLALTLAGALAGIAGAVEIQGFYHRFIDGWSGGLGFDGITVAVLGANGPIGVLMAAIFFGFLRAGALTMQTTAQVPIEMIGVIQGLILVFVAAPKLIEWLARRNIDYAKWIVKKPMNALPIFLTAIIAVIGIIISLGVGFGYLMVNALVTISLSVIAILAIGAFIWTLKVEMEGTILTAVISVYWIIVGAFNFVFEHGTLLIPLAVLGVVGLLLSIYSFYLIHMKGVVMEIQPVVVEEKEVET